MIEAVILDLDGTVYAGEAAVPGAADFVSALKQKGLRLLFVTNRANRTPAEIRAQLVSQGIPCEEADILTSAQATARHVGRGSVYCIGEDALRQELRQAGLTLTADDPEWVVVGFDREFNYDKLKTAANLIHAGAKYVATNPDAFLKTESGTVPGTGAIVNAVTTATGTEPTVVGKPEREIIDSALQRLGTAAEKALVVGDNVLTDVPAGAAAGARTALVLTGVSSRADVAAAPVQPTWVVEDYPQLLAVIEEANRRSG
jgi:4-nitrophenyl phosphatase